jgi:flotillin
MGPMTTLALIAAGACVAIIIIVKKMLYICQPNEVLIFSGTHRRVGRRVVGYKVVKGGRKLKLPLVEAVDRMDLTNMAINVAVKGAFSHGGIPLNIEGVANVKIPGEEPILGNAIERFLGMPRHEIMGIAKETLEGNLRGVLGTLTPEEVNNDKIKFAQKLMEEADHDLNRLGLVLDTLKIQNVSDEVGYLNSIGRVKGAEIRRDATVAEAASKSESVVRDASNVQETELVRIEAALRTLEADTKRRVADAQTQRSALESEERGKVMANVAEAQAEIDVQKARIEQAKRQLEADVLEPARAKMEASIADAQGLAAKIIEDGKATAEVLTQITRAWKQAGPNARDVFLMQKLPALIETLTQTVQGVRVDKVTVLGARAGGDGALAMKVINSSEQIKAALGIDLVGALQQRLGGAHPQEPTPAAVPQHITQPHGVVRPPAPASPPAKPKPQPPRE